MREKQEEGLSFSLFISFDDQRENLASIILKQVGSFLSFSVLYHKKTRRGKKKREFLSDQAI